MRLTTTSDAARMVDGIEADRLDIFVGRDSLMMRLATRAGRRAAVMIQRKIKQLLPDATQ